MAAVRTLQLSEALAALAALAALPPLSRLLLEKLTVPELVQKFPALDRTLKVITMFTKARHVSQS